ncbi:hypothetical protein [Flavobacterium sp.]|uniref:hypothetical protein n=1 Tax=Flavobacterium sp. TaxID=239 RepID=UPI003C4376F3
MRQNWIHKPLTDTFFILSPPFVILAIIVVFQKQLVVIENNYSFYTWLFLIVFIDVAHVYATLFKTYFVASEFQKRKKIYLGLPILCFGIGLFLFALGSVIFWSILAYVAVFHFIRQQYGFMRLYARNEDKTYAWIDNLVIYTATLYPMLFWFLSPKRNFNWFIPNEFFRYENALLDSILSWAYATVLLFYCIRTLYKSIKNKFFNIPKNAVIIGTTLSWYFGIVYFNNDFIFTLLNVISHGVPYIALIYLNEIEKKSALELGILHNLKQYSGLVIFIAFLLLIAFTEEYLWEITVWNEYFSNDNFDFSRWQFLIVPLLTVPQFTHYLLDAFIWKTNKK